jgi:two-component system, NarL family, sensor histidine kinase DegS
MTDRATTEPPAPASLSEIAERMSEEAARLAKELEEVELLVSQAKTEANRHETRRVAAAEKLTATLAAASARGEPAETVELNAQLVLMTKRAALMESQVDVLEGKRRALTRFRDSIAAYLAALEGLPTDGSGGAGQPAKGSRKGTNAAAAADPIGSLPPAVSRLLLGVQEDMRREIARAMHDGPAQSLTNIVLQAQIVERLVAKDPTRASTEVSQLVAMVQQTLDATKTFIFEVRPMVLDDLGLVPTLRRAARERGRHSGVAVEFESLGQDRRLPMDLESGLFRILDEALAGYLEARAERVTFKLDWSADQVDAAMSAMRNVQETASAVPDAAPGKDLPPALAAMMEERRADARTAAETAQRDSIVALPQSTWREIQGRAATLGLSVDLSPDRSEFRMLAELPAAAAET